MIASTVAGLVPMGRLTHHGFSPKQVWLLPWLPINHSKQRRDWVVASGGQDTLRLVPVQVQGVFHAVSVTLPLHSHSNSCNPFHCVKQVGSLPVFGLSDATQSERLLF